MVKIVIRMLFLGGILLVSPLILMSWCELVLTKGRSQVIFGACKELLATVPTPIGIFCRSAYYWALCTEVSLGVHFLYGSMVAHRQVTIGRGTVVGCYSIIGYADIGENVIIGSRVSLLSGRYQHGRPGASSEDRDAQGEFSRVRIGDGSWIGEGALVMADVGRGATVGAGSVVYKEVPDETTVLGNPARKVSL